MAEHNDCHGKDEEVGWEHKLKASLVSIIHTIIETQREPKVKVHKGHNHFHRVLNGLTGEIEVLA